MEYELVCVGCGPGDPELLTVKAVNAIQDADIIMCPTSKEDKPSIAYSVVESVIAKSKKNPEVVNLVFPMVKDRDVLEKTWNDNTRMIADKVWSGNKVVYLTVGDPYLYSTWIYLDKRLRHDYPDIKVNVVPGIVSMFTFVSKVGISLAEGEETFAVIPACYDLTRVKETARNCDTMVFLKDGRYFDQVVQLLKDAGFPDSSVFAIGQDLGTQDEIVRKLTLGEVTRDSLTNKYFSVLVVKRTHQKYVKKEENSYNSSDDGVKQ